MSRSRHNKRASGAFKRAAVVVVAGVVAAVAVNLVRQSNAPSRPPEPARLDRMSSRTLAAHVSVTGPVGAARAAEQWAAEQQQSRETTVAVSADVPPTPPGPPAPPTPPVPPAALVSAVPLKPAGAARAFGAKSGPYPDAEKAKFEAAAVAALELNRQLRDELDVGAAVTAADVLARYMRPASVRVAPITDPGTKQELTERRLSADQYTAVLDAEITPTQVRQLRADGRSWQAARGVGMALVCLGAVLAFLKLDGATKGYLSWGLGLGLAGAAVGGIVGLAYLL